MDEEETLSFWNKVVYSQQESTLYVCSHLWDKRPGNSGAGICSWGFGMNLLQFSHIDSEGLSEDNLQIPEALESKLDPKLDYSMIGITQRCNLNREK